MTTDVVTDRRVLDTVPRQLLIGGSWRDASGGDTFDVEDPATHGSLGPVADATAEDALSAMDSAAAAQDAWAATDSRARGEVLRRTYELMTERAPDLAVLISLEMGKSLAEAHAEVRYAAEFFRWFAEESVRVYGRYSPAPNGGGRILTVKRPVGPCLLVTPWNFPLAMGARKIAPALAAGCTTIVKAAQYTPLSMNALAAILLEAGAPAGVVNVLTSTSASRVCAPLMADSRLRKLSFTGSTEVGRTLLAQAAPQVLRTSMELGGNAPLLVFEDADLDVAVEQSYVAKMRNIGESCVAANRMYVHADVADEFARRLADRMSAATLGHGVDDGVDVGPLINEAQRDTVRSLIDDAVARGADVIAGGAAPDRPGYFWTPTVLTQVDRASRMHHEEIFGPVAAVYTFTDEDEAIRLANATEFGLAAYVFTESLARTFRLVDRIQSGMLGVNRGVISDAAAPFGGVKASGLGREGGAEGLEEYVDLTYVGLPL
jgi:succinate-semialdehyde dehydrogenase/glutarate-semialdehyde dehydrogenase